jgi:hypothetical protein
LSLANKYTVENVVDDIAIRINMYMCCYNKNWYVYSLKALFPTGWYLGDMFARYDIFQEEEKNWL